MNSFLVPLGSRKKMTHERSAHCCTASKREAERVLLFSYESRKKYKDVIAQFDVHFQVRRNVIFNRASFNKRDQRENESSEEYITALYELLETCEYGTLRDEMLWDSL